MEPVTRRETLSAIKALLEANKLPVDDLSEPGVELFCKCERGQPVAAIGLERRGTSGLLRSLVVSDEKRGQGLAQCLVSEVEAEARQNGLYGLFLLTETADEFFSKAGYTRADRDAAPAAIRETKQFSSLCPASATFMCKALN